jgi:glycosyltransferase involved in cell wall biosynthesis
MARLGKANKILDRRSCIPEPSIKEHSMKILHIITGLTEGGAEEALFRLAAASNVEVEHSVISLTDEGIYGARLRELGVVVHELGFPRGGVTLGGLRRLWRTIRETKPDAVQTWMYHADLTGGLIARLAGVRSVVWGIRNSYSSPASLSRSARLAAYLCARLSGWLPSAIVSCSERAALMHQRLGYHGSKFAVIPNGYDLGRFSPQPQVAQALRLECGIDPQVPLLGMVARWDPHKDHANLLAALALLMRRGWNFHCVLVGTGMDKSNSPLWKLISENRVQDRTSLLGRREDIPRIMNALDLLVLSSCGEAFPNVVAEAMACGTPCVVTDVGDAAAIVGGAGWVTPPCNSSALAETIEQAILAVQSPQREEMSQACRQRAVDCFAIERMAASYQAIWSKSLVVQ